MTLQDELDDIARSIEKVMAITGKLDRHTAVATVEQLWAESEDAFMGKMNDIPEPHRSNIAATIKGDLTTCLMRELTPAEFAASLWATMRREKLSFNRRRGAS